MNVLRRVWAASVWSSTGTDPDDFRDRWTQRVWLPVYLACMTLAGVGVVRSGSPVLDRVFEGWVVDGLGWVLVTASLTALTGVIFPRWWAVQIIGLIVVVGMAGVYGAALLFASDSASSRDFLAWMVMCTVPMAFAQLTRLGEGIKERRPTA